MRLIFLLSTVFVISQASTENQQTTLWKTFKHTFNKQYKNVQEEQHRLDAFNNNLIMINRHNREAADGLHSYTLKMNQFGDMTHDEFARIMLGGVKISTAATVGKRLRGRPFHPPADVDLPAVVDWRKKGAVIKAIETQGQCGSCWAFAANGALESQHFIKTGHLVRLSAQNLMDCSGAFGNQGCSGGWMDAAFQYIKANKGVDTEVSYPYEAVDGKCRFNRTNVGATDTGFVDLPPGNETSLQIAIAYVGPISVAVDGSRPSFQFYSSGVYDDPSCSSTAIDHSFVLVGYDTYNNGTTKKEYYSAKNSWGEAWGDKGYIWMSRNRNNQCGIANIGSYPLV